MLFSNCCFTHFIWSHNLLLAHVPEYCEKYAKPEDIGAVQEDEQSSEEELSEDGYASSDGDDEVAGKADPWCWI